MKSFLAALLITLPALAHAYAWNQTIDFNPNPQINALTTYSFTHDLTAPGVGFNLGSDAISDYSLTINLLNDRGQLDVVYIDQPGNIFTDGGALLYNWKTASVKLGDSYAGLLSLTDTGKLSVSVTSLFGSFFLDSSELAVTGEKGTVSASVPEPASVALLAIGLIGIAVMRRTHRPA